MKLTVFLSSLFFMLLVGCSQKTATLTPMELNLHPDKYHGQVVHVRGVIVLGSNSRALYQSEELLAQRKSDFENDKPAFMEDYDNYCLTLIDTAMIWDNRSLLSGKTVTLKGTFERNYLDGATLDLQACSEGTALSIDPISFADTIRQLNEEQKH